MGIRGLTGWIRWAAKQTIRTPQWEEWRGKTIGIDILGFLYTAKARQQCPFLYIGKLIATCKKYEIRPIPIFDGKPPEEKREALLQRSRLRHESDTKRTSLTTELESLTMSESQRETIECEVRKLQKRTCYLTSDERDQAKKLFYACGILSLNASGEADNVLAYLVKRGCIDAVMSNDLDLLARGVETLLVPEYVLSDDVPKWTQYTLSDILHSVQLDYNQFLEMCVLMGCDYTVGQYSIPYKSAFWAIKYRGSIEKTLETVGVDTAVYKKAIQILRGDQETKESLMGEKQWEKWASGSPVCEPDVLQSLRKSVLESMSEQDFLQLCQSQNDHGEERSFA